VAKNGSIDDADPIVIKLPVDESAKPLPCNPDPDAGYNAEGYDTAGAISCAELSIKGACNASDPASRNNTCNGRGDTQLLCPNPNPNPKPKPKPEPNPNPNPSPSPHQATVSMISASATFLTLASTAPSPWAAFTLTTRLL
jgi:hypothetical protein